MTNPDHPFSEPRVASDWSWLRSWWSRTVVVGLVLIVGGAIAFVVGAIVYFAPSSSQIDHFQRVGIAGRAGAVTFNGRGKYVAYYESPTVGRRSIAPFVEVTLTDARGRRFTLTTPYDRRHHGTVFTYSNDGHHGVAMYRIQISQPGRFGVTLRPGPVGPFDGVVAFGRPITHSAAGATVIIGPGAFVAVAGVSVLVVAFVRLARRNLVGSRPSSAGV